MEKLLINSQGLVNGFLERYQIWKDYNKFYNNDSQDSMIEINSQGIPVFHYTDVDNINSNASSLIAIDCLTEGLHSSRCFRRYNKNKHYIIFSNGFWPKDSTDLDISYDIVFHLFFLFEMANTYLSPDRFCFYLDKTYEFEYPKPCIFTSTVGNVRTQRDYFVNLLKEKITYNNFILQYSGETIGVDVSHLDVVNFKKGEFDPYTSIIEKYYHNVSQTLPLAIYNQSYFNIIVETDIDYTDNFFLTEKTVKSLLTGMPFVVVTTPNFLNKLRQLGFTTYNTLWDESYDSIIDYKSRLEAIVKLCITLGKFDWEAHRLQLMEIQSKNQNNFFNLNKIATQEFKNFESIIKQL
jgi:hypothetical protein